MSDSMTLWLDNAGRYPLLSEEETLELARRIQRCAGNTRRKALDKLCLHNLRLVVEVVKKMVRKRQMRMGSEPTLDFLQMGYLGLRRACEKFDPTRGYRFSTYAVPWIRQAVHRYSLSQENSIYVPEATVHEVYYRSVNDGKPSCAKGARMAADILHAGSRALSISSIDVNVGDEENTRLSEMLSAENHVNYSYEGRCPFALLRRKMDEIGIDSHSQELFVQYAKRGRMSIAAVKANYNRKAASGRIREIRSALEAMA